MSLYDEKKYEEIISRINKLTPDAKAVWGKMNANQMLCHVTDQLRVSLGEAGEVKDASSFMSRTLLKFLVLNVIPIPKNVPTSSRVDQMKDGTPPTDFEADRKTLLGFIEKFVSAPNDFEFSPHFKFGNLSGKEWAVLASKHLDHHLKQFGV
jgi:hypothetical protein